METLPLRPSGLARLSAVWRGPDGLPSELRMEWHFVLVRWVGIALVAPALLTLPFAEERKLAGFAILAIAAVYNAILQRSMVRHATPETIGWLATAFDTTLNIAMMLALGVGFDSPFGLFLFVIVIFIAMRHGYAASLTAVGLFLLTNVAVDFGMGKGLDGAFFFRAFFLAMAALMPAFVVEQARRDRAELMESHDQVTLAYTELAAAHQELLQVDEMKTNFIANVSHELRTPLTSVLAYTELLLSYDAPPETQREFLTIVHGESERLTRLINEVLDISRIESGDVELRRDELDARDLVETSTNTVRASAEMKGLSLDVELPEDLPPLAGDRDRLLQVMSNLLSNAVKFTPEGTVRVAARHVGDTVQIAVSDTGIGIPEDEQPLVFEKFHQVLDTSLGKPSGAGLGLAICRELVMQHGGRIWVESEHGAGSTFTVELPVNGAGSLTPPGANGAAAPRATRAATG